MLVELRIYYQEQHAPSIVRYNTTSYPDICAIEECLRYLSHLTLIEASKRNSHGIYENEMPAYLSP